VAAELERRRVIASRPPTIRVLFGTLLTLVMLLAAGLFSVTILQRDTAARRTDAEHQRVTSFRLSDQMRQSSNDLTRMVRLYVTTGEPRYRRFYDEILAIRRGVAPRPRDYDSSFWDRVLAEGQSTVRTGPPTSLPELMRRARFAPAEFTALNASLRASDHLARLERRVMDVVAPRIAAGVDRAYLGDVAPQYRLLVDDAYHREKRRIMNAIERFTRLVDARTSAHTAALQARTERLLVSQTGILVLLAITLLLTLALAARTIARPLARLTAVTRRIAGGDWSQRAPAAGVAELRELAGDFNDMADAVEHDLAGRRRAERDARDASQRLRTIADRVPGAVFHFHVDVDSALSVRFASRDGSVHGAAADQDVDFPAVARAVDADDRGAWLDSMVAAARAGGPWRHEYRVHTRSGQIAWMQAQAIGQPADDGSGELYGYVADVTERKALEDELRRAREAAESADRAKSAFLAMVSHELRTPLVAVTGTLEVLALGELGGEQRALVDVATRSARSLLGVIGDVLDFSKIEAGHLDLVAVPTAVGSLVEDVVTQHRLAAPAGGVVLRTSVDEQLAAAHEADPGRLRQVLGNLVGNAVKFTREGFVDVRVEVCGEADAGAVQRVAILVEDTGVGVSRRDQARLFAPFEQAGPDGARRGGGTGLGLVICRQLVEAMGGRVEMASELGRGTTMRVELALAVAVEPAGGAGLDGAGAPPGRRALPSRAEAEREGSLLLLVEDHPVNREILVLQLQAIGFATDAAADAGDALERCERARYGLVFTDIGLPGADGYELARRLRVLERAAGRERAPIVALTASALRGERERCAEAGMDDLVVKPATLATLAQTLRRWLPDGVWRGDAEAAAVTAAPVAAVVPVGEAAAVAGAPVAAVVPVGEAAAVAGARVAAVVPVGEAAAVAQAAVAGPAIDRAALDELTGGDEELNRDILTRYLVSLGDDLEALGQALRDRDVIDLRRHAHRIAGASSTVGAHAVAAQAARLERAAQSTQDGAELERLALALRQTAAR
jgi:signal transduction histidine kinase/CheY-like chemotaxis protein/HPt (histidine-containing phosphotransfer) domain-containing protein